MNSTTPIVVEGTSPVIHTLLKQLPGERDLELIIVIAIAAAAYGMATGRTAVPTVQ